MSAFVVTGQRARQMRVVPAEVLKRLYKRSDWHGLVQTAGHLALLIVGGWLVLATKGTWVVVPALLIQGLFVNALFGAMHESVHYGSFKTRWMADLLAFFSGAAILNNAGFYRHYHNGFHFTKEELHSMPDGYLSRLIHDNYVILVWPLIGLPIALILSLSISIIRKWFWLNPVIVFIVVLSLKVLWAQEKIATTPWTFLQYVFNKPGYFFKG